MPCTVDAWLKSPEFTELQLLEFYYSPGNHIPHTERHELVPSTPMSISRFSSSLNTATFVLCYLPDNLVLNLRLPFLKKLSLVRSYIGGFIAQHHPLQLPRAGVLGACFHS